MIDLVARSEKGLVRVLSSPVKDGCLLSVYIGSMPISRTREPGFGTYQKLKDYFEKMRENIAVELDRREYPKTEVEEFLKEVADNIKTHLN